MLGFGGDTEMAQCILNGTANISQITDNKAAQFLLESMKRNTDPIFFDFTPNDMMNCYKNWKEKTVTSVYSGRHLGHFHALYHAFLFFSVEDYNKVCHKRSMIIQLHRTMLVIAAKNKYVYKLWKHIVTQIIEKDQGCPKLYRLHVIHL